MGKGWRYAGRTGLAVFGAAVAYWLLLVFPNLFFRLERVENLSVYHHSSPEKVRPAAARALAKIKRSALYRPEADYRVFLTASTGEYAFYTSLWRGSGGMFLIFAGGNIFIRPSDVEADWLIGPDGRAVADDRPLNYFIAHEVMHAMTFDELGLSKYLALNEWVREGLADRTGRDRPSFEELLDAYRAGRPEMNREKSGLYLKYLLLVEYAQRHRNLDAAALLERNPAEVEIEAALKAQFGAAD